MSEKSKVPCPGLYDFTVKHVFPEVMRTYGAVTTHDAAEALEGLRKPYIFAPVHLSMLDTLVLALSALEADGTQVHFLAKPEMWKIPLLGPYVSLCGAIKVDRDKPLSAKNLEKIQRIVENEGVFGIFPQGGRSEGNEVQRKDLKRSVAALALQHGMPIVPVGIVGTEAGHRGPIHLTYGKPLNADRMMAAIDMNEPRSYVQATRPLMDQLHLAMNVAQAAAVEFQAAA
jgi:1-acyl-sn-glycerol-3-phosphate acyltransferase